MLEDAAIVSAALLSADGLISTKLAFLALFLGIFTGDLGLYFIGTQLKRVPWLARKLDLGAIDRARGWLQRNMTTTVLLVRVIPGLRLPAYVACGYFQLSFSRFFCLVLLASLIWTGVVFSGFYLVGALFWSELSSWKWLILPAIFLLIMYGHRNIRLSDKLMK
ncbi:MAG: DedA family protein [Endozoicomonas sp.]